MKMRALRIVWLFLAVLSVLSPGYVIGQTTQFPEIKVYIDADQSFVAKAGGAVAATQFIHELVARVDAIYRSQAGLTVSIAGIHLWSGSDPFNRTSDSTLLSSFKSYAESTYRGAVTYDAAHLLVGEGLGGEGGIAYPASACGDVFSAPYAYSLSQPDVSDQYEFNAHVFSHELGHNLGAEHDSYPSCKVTTIMCPGQIGGTFTADSVSAMQAYVTSRQSSGCFNAISKSDPVAQVRLSATIVSNSVKYTVTGAENCTSLAIVAAPTLRALNIMFSYLQLGTLTPAATVKAVSKSAPTLATRKSQIYFGAFCDGQLASHTASIVARKIKSKKYTTSLITELRSLQRGFRKQG